MSYTGDTSIQQRNQALNDFRRDPNITVFLATIDTAGYGITLIEATYVIHFDHPWNPAKMQNAEDRTHRIGQKSSVTVYSFWMKGTIEERIKKKLIDKRLLVENVVDDLAVEAIENGFSTDDWLDIFGVTPTVRNVEVEAQAIRHVKLSKKKISSERDGEQISKQSLKKNAREPISRILMSTMQKQIQEIYQKINKMTEKPNNTFNIGTLNTGAGAVNLGGTVQGDLIGTQHTSTTNETLKQKLSDLCELIIVLQTQHPNQGKRKKNELVRC